MLLLRMAGFVSREVPAVISGAWDLAAIAAAIAAWREIALDELVRGRGVWAPTGADGGTCACATVGSRGRLTTGGMVARGMGDGLVDEDR